MVISLSGASRAQRERFPVRIVIEKLDYDSVYNEPILFLTLKIQNVPRHRTARFRRKVLSCALAAAARA